MPTVVFVDHLDQLQTAQASEGGSFVKLCDEVDSPVPFHCRRANCGTCRIAVLEGVDELLPPEDRELDLLRIFGLSPRKYRLACQARMRPGLATLRVRPLEKRAHRRYSLWIPVTLDIASKQIRACKRDPSAGDILITGTTELRVSDVVLVTFRPPSESKSHNVVGRIIRVEPSGDVDGGTRRYTTAIEFLEPDETLTTLFQRASAEPPLARCMPARTNRREGVEQA